MIIPTLLVVRKIQNLMWLKKISSIFSDFFENWQKVCQNYEIRQKKVTVLILPCVAWNWIKMDPSISGLVWFNMGSFRSQVFSWLFFLTQIFLISEYCQNLAPSQILEGYYGKLENVMPIFFTTHEVPISLDRLSQKNTK